MSQQDNFSGGFLVGAIVGGLVGGLLGAVLASKRLSDAGDEALLSPADSQETKPARPKKRQLKASSERDIEAARRSLEDKIAQLNEAIDDVRQQLGNVNGEAAKEPEARSIVREP